MVMPVPSISNIITCAPSENYNTTMHLPSQIRVSAIRQNITWVIRYLLGVHRILWSYTIDFQVDLGKRESLFLLMSYDCWCSVSLTHYVVVWSAFCDCDCGNSWSFSFTFRVCAWLAYHSFCSVMRWLIYINYLWLLLLLLLLLSRCLMAPWRSGVAVSMVLYC